MKQALLSVGALVLALVMAWTVGYMTGAESMRRQYRQAALETAAENAKKTAETISNYIQKMDDLDRRNRTLSADSARLQQRLRAVSGTTPGGACAKRLAECRQFLGEGVGLLGEGAELAGRIAARKDALTGMK